MQRSDETEEEAAEKKESEDEEKPDPLTQLVTCLSRAATKEQQSSMPEDDLYISYAQIMSMVCFSLRIFLAYRHDRPFPGNFLEKYSNSSSSLYPYVIRKAHGF